VFVNCRN